MKATEQTMSMYDAHDASAKASRGAYIAAECDGVIVEIVEHGDFLLNGQRYCLHFDLKNALWRIGLSPHFGWRPVERA